MIYLALGAGLLWFLLYVQKQRPILRHPQWRIGSGMLAIGLFALAAFLAVRGEAILAIVPVIIALCLTAVTRLPRQARAAAPEPSLGPITVSEAYAILDLQPGATREEIQTAYMRLMKLVHPDRGGGSGLAAKLNAARDRLLKG
ncbi:MAG: dnaJ-class molecular chaperone [Caulobacteraceae bacterium]|nr:dnaJ-class molecular chaperone [Caulobacteraceae bacterium]